MAEFCLKCWNKLNETDDPEGKYIISDDLDFCDLCEKWTHVIVMVRKEYYLMKLRFVILPFKIIYVIMAILLKIPILPYLLYKRKKNRIEAASQG